MTLPQFNIVKENEVLDFLNPFQVSDFFKRFLFSGNRDFIIATQNDWVVGITILFKKHLSQLNSISDTVTLSNIEVKKEYKNTGIASGMLKLVPHYCKKHDLTLLRTRPTEEGERYIFNKFTQILDKQNSLYVPHNLVFVYDDLNRFVFSNGVYDRTERLNIMYQVAQQAINSDNGKKYNLTVDSLNTHFLDETRDSIKKLFPINQ